MPEAAIPLANIVTFLATAPKSNTSYLAYFSAMEDISKGLGISVPKHLQSPLFEGYIYPHDYENDYVNQRYLPEDLANKKYYSFGQNKTEQAAKAYHEFIVSSCRNKKK
jgi:putative ATPase